MEHAVIIYLEDYIRTYEGHPPETRYEEGFLAALRELLAEISIASEERPTARLLH